MRTLGKEKTIWFSRKRVSPLLLLALIFSTGLAASGVAADGPNKGASKSETSAKSKGTPEQPQTYARPTDPSLYVGTETCKTCHEDVPSKDFYKNYEASPHFATMLDTKKGPEWRGQDQNLYL